MHVSTTGKLCPRGYVSTNGVSRRRERNLESVRVSIESKMGVSPRRERTFQRQAICVRAATCQKIAFCADESAILAATGFRSTRKWAFRVDENALWGRHARASKAACQDFPSCVMRRERIFDRVWLPVLSKMGVSRRRERIC